MKRIRYAGLALVIVGALGVTIASTAVAHTFNSDVMASLKGSADATQVFTTAAGKVECKKILVIVGVTGLTVKTLIVIIIYEECKAFGLAATVSPAEYEFDADGTASVLKEITIKAVACEVKVPGGAANAKLGTIVYKNNGTGVLLEPNVTKITSTGVGAACNYAKESKGTYVGNSHESAAGGTVAWS